MTQFAWGTHSKHNQNTQSVSEIAPYSLYGALLYRAMYYFWLEQSQGSVCVWNCTHPIQSKVVHCIGNRVTFQTLSLSHRAMSLLWAVHLTGLDWQTERERARERERVTAHAWQYHVSPNTVLVLEIAVSNPVCRQNAQSFSCTRSGSFSFSYPSTHSQPGSLLDPFLLIPISVFSPVLYTPLLFSPSPFLPSHLFSSHFSSTQLMNSLTYAAAVFIHIWFHILMPTSL